MDQEVRLGLVLIMEPGRKDRRHYCRGGLFSQIEDATYRVLRKAEQDAPRQAVSLRCPARGAEDDSPEIRKELASENVAA